MACWKWHWVADGKQVGGLLIGQLLHVQGHRPCLVALLIVFGDIHVPLRVPCVISHPYSDRSTRNGYLEDTGMDGAGRDRKTRSDLRPGLGWDCGPLCTGVVAGRKSSDVSLWALGCSQIRRVWREGPSHLPASSASSWPPPRSALPVPGPVPPCCSSQHAPPLPIRGGVPDLASHIELLADAILGSVVAGNEEGDSASWGGCGER